MVVHKQGNLVFATIACGNNQRRTVHVVVQNGIGLDSLNLIIQAVGYDKEQRDPGGFNSRHLRVVCLVVLAFLLNLRYSLLTEIGGEVAVGTNDVVLHAFLYQIARQKVLLVAPVVDVSIRDTNMQNLHVTVFCLR